MKYSFHTFINKDYFGDSTPRPAFKIENQEIAWILAEFSQLSSQYLQEIVVALEEVKAGERESYDFGYDMTIVCIEKDRTYLWYDHPKKEMDVDFEEIYNLMKDWKDYIAEWEKETGLVKK